METLACSKICADGSRSFLLSQRRVFCSLLGQNAQMAITRRLFHRCVGCKRRHSRHQLKPVVVCSELHSDGAGCHRDQDDYVNSSVLEAVEVKSGTDGFLIRMQDGRYIKCVHNNPDGGRLPDYAPQPAIILKIEDGSDLLLPIIVLELPAAMLMETLRNVHLARPTIYQVLKDLIELMGFKVKLVRVTKRVKEAYYAQLILCKVGILHKDYCLVIMRVRVLLLMAQNEYLVNPCEVSLWQQVGDEMHEISLDLRPSDAINIAARCQVPIQVNRQLAYGDGVRIVNDAANIPSRRVSSSFSQHSSFGMAVTMGLDRPQAADQVSSLEAEEFVLVRSMLMAAAEERYLDAARIRDKLKELRTKEGI